MIINFSIENYRSIKEQILLSFEASKSDDLENFYVLTPIEGLRLLKLGLIFGANASGKTTILRALNFMRDLVIDPLEKKTDKLDFQPFLFNENTINENTKFSIKFIKNKNIYLYNLEFNKNYIHKEELYYYNPNKALVFRRNTNPDKKISSIKLGSKIKFPAELKNLLEVNTIWNNTVIGGFLKSNIDFPQLTDVLDWFTINLKPIITPNIDLLSYISKRVEEKEIDKKNIVKFLKKADFKIDDIIIKKRETEIEPDIVDFFLKKAIDEDEINELNKLKENGKIENKEIVFLHKFSENGVNKIYELPYGSESNGTKRYYQFSGLLEMLIKNETILPIDEIESSLHPDLFKYFLLTFLYNSKKSQLICTTHNREILNEKEILRNDVIWFTDKKDNGSTELYSLEDFDSSIIRNTSSIYNAYKIGKLGAKPIFEDYYYDLNDE